MGDTSAILCRLRLKAAVPRHLAAVLVSLLGSGVQRLAFDSAPLTPRLFDYLGIIAAAWLGGTRAALLGAAAVTVAAAHFAFPHTPEYFSHSQVFATSPAALRATVVFFLTTSTVAVLAGALENALEYATAVAQRLSALTDAMPQMVWERSARGFEFANQNFLAFTGLPAEAVRDDPTAAAFLSLVHPDDRARVQAAWAQSVKTGDPYSVEYRLRRAKDGQYVWFLSRALPLRDRRGEVVRWLGTCTGIDEIKQGEATLRECNERLAEADRRKDGFLASLSHELRNPLAAIRGALFVLDRATPGGAQAQRAQAVLHRQSDHLTRLVDDLLDVTRIARGKVRLQPECVELVALARRTADDFAPLFAARSIDFCVRLPSCPVYVDADPTRIVQVLGNLLQNALKFTPPRGRARLSLDDQEADRVTLRVRDNGAGLPPDLLPKLFEPFLQGENTLDRSSGGLGLGLALVKGIVELHGGEVRAASEGLGTGAEFSVTLPRLPPGAAEEGAATKGAGGAGAVVEEVRPRAAPAGKNGGRRVLLIEDNEDAASILKDALEMEHHVVEVASTGCAGVEAAQRFLPDVVLCDIGLPDHDGYWVARTLRSDPKLRAVTLVALSGYATAEDVARGRAAGFDGHLAKPADLDALQRTLAEATPRETSPPW